MVAFPLPCVCRRISLTVAVVKKRKEIMYVTQPQPRHLKQHFGHSPLDGRRSSPNFQTPASSSTTPIDDISTHLTGPKLFDSLGTFLGDYGHRSWKFDMTPLRHRNNYPFAGAPFNLNTNRHNLAFRKCSIGLPHAPCSSSDGRAMLN